VVEFEKHPRNRDLCTSALAECGHGEPADWPVTFNVAFNHDCILDLLLHIHYSEWPNSLSATPCSIFSLGDYMDVDRKSIRTDNVGTSGFYRLLTLLQDLRIKCQMASTFSCTTSQL
jgi:hypothetical protein